MGIVASLVILFIFLFLNVSVLGCCLSMPLLIMSVVVDIFFLVAVILLSVDVAELE